VSTGEQVRVQVTTAYAGVTAGNNSLHFNVSVYNNTRGFLYLISLNVPGSAFLGTSVSLSHALSLQPGSYQFSATFSGYVLMLRAQVFFLLSYEY